MKNIRISDMTLSRSRMLSFKEKIEVARLLEMLKVDKIELPEIENIKSDTLLIKTMASFVKSATLSVCGGFTRSGVELAATALSTAQNPEIRIELPLSPVGMEYTCHKKAPKMLELTEELVSLAKESCANVQFCAVDATRADKGFLKEVLSTAVNAGATSVTVCDTAAEMLPDAFSEFVAEIRSSVPELEGIEFGVCVEDKNAMAAAASVMAVNAGADTVKLAASGTAAKLSEIAGIIKNCGDSCGFKCGIKHTETGRIVKQIIRIISPEGVSATAIKIDTEDNVWLDSNDGNEAVATAVKSLGYDLSEEDNAKVYEEFKNIAAKKRVGAKELDAIVASTALQVPPTYKLVSYVINSGNIISSSAQVRLSNADTENDGICIGDGPVDAAFRAIEQIIGRHYELEDFQIHTVTEGRESVGSAVVKLRENGKLYSGTGISTDIVGAGIRAYLNALNKIVYEEVN